MKSVSPPFSAALLRSVFRASFGPTKGGDALTSPRFSQEDTSSEDRVTCISSACGVRLTQAGRVKSSSRTIRGSERFIWESYTGDVKVVAPYVYRLNAAEVKLWAGR